jgi:hypothetical protein
MIYTSQIILSDYLQEPSKFFRQKKTASSAVFFFERGSILIFNKSFGNNFTFIINSDGVNSRM